MKKGFTILEIIVVIGLITIILGSVLVYLPSVRNKGEDAVYLSENHRLSLALEKYYAVCGQYPADLNGEVDLTSANGCSNSETFADFMGADVEVDHSYLPLSLEEASGVCDIGYIVAFTVDSESNLLDDDDDYVLNPMGSAPYLCTGTGGFDGDDSSGLYDIVQPSSLKQ